MIDEDIQQWFLEQGFRGNEYLAKEKTWKGFELYSVCYKKDGDYGSPIFVMKKRDEIRYATYDEVDKILDYLC